MRLQNSDECDREWPISLLPKTSSDRACGTTGSICRQKPTWQLLARATDDDRQIDSSIAPSATLRNPTSILPNGACGEAPHLRFVRRCAQAARQRKEWL